MFINYLQTVVVDNYIYDTTRRVQGTSLIGGKQYTISLDFSNSLGTKHLEQTSPIVYAPASAPTNITYNRQTRGSLTIYWNAPTDTGGADISKYYVQISKSVDPWPNTFIEVDVLSPRQYTFTGILDSTSYDVRLYAKNTYQMATPNAGTNFGTATNLASFAFIAPEYYPVATTNRTSYAGNQDKSLMRFDNSGTGATNYPFNVPCGIKVVYLCDGVSGETSAPACYGGYESPVVYTTSSTLVCNLAGSYTCNSNNLGGCWTGGNTAREYHVKFAYYNSAGVGPSSPAYKVQFYRISTSYEVNVVASTLCPGESTCADRTADYKATNLSHTCPS
jgi:hypothetical protein